MPAGKPSGVKRRSVRAGREGETSRAGSVELGEGANAREERRDCGVAFTSWRAFSYSASSWMSMRMIGTSSRVAYRITTPFSVDIVNCF